MTSRRFAATLLLLGCVLLRLPAASAQTRMPAEEFSAIYANISTVGAVGAAPVTIRITRWTDDAENAKLMTLLREKGTEALVRELTGTRSTGSIGTPQELPYDLRYARQYPLEKGRRRIILMTDRPMAPSERMSASVSRDYPLTWIEMNLDANGRGDGSISLAARLQLLGDVLGIEDYGNQPAKLNDIKKIK